MQAGRRSVGGPIAPLVERISRLEIAAAAAVAVVFAVLIAIEPDVVRAPIHSTRAVVVVVVGTLLAAATFIVMLQRNVRPVVRFLVLGVPLAAASWWTISPFFRDTVVDDRFATSIAASGRGAPATASPADGAPSTTTPPSPSGPTLLGAGSFVGLAGHHGTGDAGIFRLDDGSLVLRLEQLRLDNGPDLQLYLVPGPDRRSPTDRAHHFGALRGNVGNQTYEIPGGYEVTSGAWTVLVWCRAFTVEFVAATLTVS